MDQVWILKVFNISMDLSFCIFWIYKERATHDNEKIYEWACCDGETAEELEILLIDEISNKIRFMDSR